MSNSRNKIHQTREQPYRDSLYICGQYPSSQRECPNVNEFNVCWVIQRLISYLTPKRTLLSSSFRRAHHLGRKRRRRDAAFCSASDFFSLLKNVSFDSSKSVREESSTFLTIINTRPLFCLSSREFAQLSSPSAAARLASIEAGGSENVVWTLSTVRSPNESQ